MVEKIESKGKRNHFGLAHVDKLKLITPQNNELSLLNILQQ